MAVFQIGKSVKTTEPIVDVESTPDAPLLPGVYVFELVVIDDAGNESRPVHARVTVADPGPTAVIAADEKVPFGHTFKLDGSKSSDVPPGKVISYVWTMSRPSIPVIPGLPGTPGVPGLPGKPG